MPFENLFASPIGLLGAGLALNSPIAAAHYHDLMILLNDGLVALEQRPGEAGYFLTLSEAGLHFSNNYQRKLSKEPIELPSSKNVAPPFDIITKQLTKRFKDLRPQERFRIKANGAAHKLKFKKINNNDEDNAMTDTETPDVCSFPADQLVFPIT